MTTAGTGLDPVARELYRRVMRRLQAEGIPFLVGGAYAFDRYTGIARHTKDFDLFIHPRDVDRTLEVLAAEGCKTDIPFPHWLAKAQCGEDVVDLIYSSGNGVALVDDGWFRHSVEETVLDVPVQLIPAEEMIWSKAFIMERERYDGGDIAHILRACAEQLDWPRLLQRFDLNWRVLFKHLVIFGFIYPCERARIPAAVMRELMGRLDKELTRPAAERVCRGTLISRAQYLVDVEHWGYSDPRLAPQGNMTSAERERWTAGIADDGPGAPPILRDEPQPA
jgi:putative nucleotidyltransferase-like protein